MSFTSQWEFNAECFEDEMHKKFYAYNNAIKKIELQKELNVYVDDITDYFQDHVERPEYHNASEQERSNMIYRFNRQIELENITFNKNCDECTVKIRYEHLYNLTPEFTAFGADIYVRRANDGIISFYCSDAGYLNDCHDIKDSEFNDLFEPLRKKKTRTKSVPHGVKFDTVEDLFHFVRDADAASHANDADGIRQLMRTFC